MDGICCRSLLASLDAAPAAAACWPRPHPVLSRMSRPPSELRVARDRLQHAHMLARTDERTQSFVDRLAREALDMSRGAPRRKATMMLVCTATVLRGAGGTGGSGRRRCGASKIRPAAKTCP
jgi:hypothetical protein